MRNSCSLKSTLIQMMLKDSSGGAIWAQNGSQDLMAKLQVVNCRWAVDLLASTYSWAKVAWITSHLHSTSSITRAIALPHIFKASILLSLICRLMQLLETRKCKRSYFSLVILEAFTNKIAETTMLAITQVTPFSTFLKRVRETHKTDFTLIQAR